MSTITTDLPQEPLRWWKLRLPRNDDGHYMFVSLDEPDVDLATQCVQEIFDGCDGEITDVVQFEVETRYGVAWLWALSRYRPSACAGWIGHEPIVIPRPHYSYVDSIPEFGP